jgi:hypothetical protein
VKPKKCKVCATEFSPAMSLQRTCSPRCAIEDGRVSQKNEFKRTTRVMKAKAKTKAMWLKEAQAVFNKFIRLRDSVAPCISCDRHHQGQYHAGHYRSVGANPELRFIESNCNKQCYPCNTRLSGNLIRYRVRLIRKIGIDRVEWLEGPHEPAKYTVDDIIAIKAEYTKKVRELSE